MTLSLLHSKTALKYYELFLTFGATCTGIASGVIADIYKRYSISFAFAFAFVLLAAKISIYRMENREQVEKKEADRKAQEDRDLERAEAKEANRKAQEERDQAIAEARCREAATLARALKGVLDHLHQQYFKNVPKANKNLHRATLFKCVDSGDGSGGGKQLIIFARSGLYLDSKTSWPVDDNDRNKCRGVAAHIFYDSDVQFRQAACPYPTDGDPAKIGNYAASLGLTLEEVAMLRVKSVAFLGVRIDVNDRAWGVLLLDSNEFGVLKNPVGQHHLSTPVNERRTLEQYAAVIQFSLTEVGR